MQNSKTYSIAGNGTIPAHIDGTGNFITNGVNVYAVGTAQQFTTTLTGIAGSAIITVNGVEYLAEFDTDLDGTATKFVTDHAAAILADAKVVVTANGADGLDWDPVIPGVAYEVSDAINESGSLAGLTVETAANVEPTADFRVDFGVGDYLYNNGVNGGVHEMKPVAAVYDRWYMKLKEAFTNAVNAATAVRIGRRSLKRLRIQNGAADVTINGKTLKANKEMVHGNGRNTDGVEPVGYNTGANVIEITEEY